jgi:MipA family protein
MKSLSLSSTNWTAKSVIFLAMQMTCSPSSVVTAKEVAKKSDKPDMLVLIGGGVESRPKFPGSASNSLGFAPEVKVWREGEAFPIETPDESNGFAIVGKRGKTSIGPTIAFAKGRKGRDVGPGFNDIGFGMEIGGYAESYIVPALRFRAELRQAIGAHKSLTGDVAADFVIQGKDEKIVATIGPRIRWANSKYHQAFFGVSPATSLASGLMPYQPSGGIYAYGLSSGAHLRIDQAWGVYGYLGYDRLTGDAAASPIISGLGKPDQVTAGLVLTRRFRIKR